MCGIAGYYGSLDIPAERRAHCLTLMRRRGPNAARELAYRTTSGRYLYLLHSRLSIIDLDPRADQPFAVAGGYLSYNGEIYNYVELKQELAAAGHCFATTSDTEVLARLLAEEGEAGVGRCEGMWAFAWFDSRAESLLLSRDRFGEKPLYLHQDHSGVYFGSEPKFVFALLGRRLPVNDVQVKRYLVNGYKSLYKGADTFFVGLAELPAGSVAGFNDEGRRWNRFYWRPSFDGAVETLGYDEAVAGTRDRLVRSVEIRLRADVPVAFCLSGGVDSNALIAIAKRELGYDVHGFTIMNTDSRYEEREMVETSVRELDLRHTAVPVDTRNFLPNLRELVRYHDAPVYTITYYAQWRLMEAIRAAGYKVSVSGTAADELFSGYFDHHNAYLAAMKATDPGRYETARADWKRVVAPLVRNPYLQDPDYFVKRPEARDHIYLDAKVFSGLLNEPWQEPFTEERYAETLLRNRMANELLHESVPVILHEDDLNAMYFSVENRSPYLDTALYEWCRRIPTRHLVRNGRAKAVLRDAVRGLAPDAIVDNPRKVGFNAPLHGYLDVRSDAVRDELLSPGPIFDLVRRDGIEEMLDLPQLPNSRSKFLFNFICAKMFLEEFAS